MADEDVLRSIKSQTLNVIRTITENPKPSYSIDGQAVSWSDYLAQLQATVVWCNQQLHVEEPFEIQSRGYT